MSINNLSGNKKGFCTMSFDLTAKFNNAGIDKSVLKQVSQEILKRANANNGTNFDVNNINLKSFSQTKQPELGLNLYNGSVDATTAKQIALNNSALQINLSQNVMDSIKYLNTQAAQKVANNGNLTINVNETVPQVVSPENPSIAQGILSFATDKDKSGSQTPYKGELLQFGQDDNDNNDNNIFSRIV